MGRQKNRRYQRSLNSSTQETRKRSALGGSVNRRSCSGKVRLAIERKHRSVRELKKKSKQALTNEKEQLKEFESGFESESENDGYYSNWNQLESNSFCYKCDLEEFYSDSAINYNNNNGSSAYNSMCSRCSCQSSIFSSSYNRRSHEEGTCCSRSLPSTISASYCSSCMISKSAKKRSGIPTCAGSESDSWSLWEVPKESGVISEGFPPIKCEEIRVNQLTRELEELDNDTNDEVVNENVSLGLIYVPMSGDEDGKEVEVRRDTCSNEADEANGGTLQDGFGSLESLIFQPKDGLGDMDKVKRDERDYGKVNCEKGGFRGGSSGDTITSWKYFELGSGVEVSEREVKGKKRVTWKMIKGCKDKSELFSVRVSGNGIEGKMADGVNPGSDVKRRLISGLKNKLNCFKNKCKHARGDLSLDRHSSWSDLESLIFAEQNSEMFSCPRNVEIWPGQNGRMESYYDDWWLFWDQQRKSRKKNVNNISSKNNNSTWKAKSKRMLLWMFQSQASLNHGKALQWSWWKAKQRSSILWLIAKANNNKVPDDLKEPYYKDHEDQDQLKPVIIHALASAECYCLALGNIYADPNYHRLNHWGVIQALARKGVYVAEPSDVALTETVLIQTSPIRMSAHMAVIEAIMALYIKETVTTERIVQAIKKFSSFSASSELPADTEEALVLWINKACVKMKHRIEEELHAYDPEIHKDKKEQNAAPELKTGGNEKKGGGESDNKEGSENAEDGKSGRYMDLSPPAIPILGDLSDLSDGCCLATLLSFYCPSTFKWQDICYSSPMTMSDSLYNLQLVQKFCRDHLPFNPCFLTLEDLVYQHSSVRQNILGFLSDLFFLLEIKPARCVQLHTDGTADGQNSRTFLPLVGPAGNKRMFQQSSVSPIPDLRSSAYSSMPDINRISPKSAVSPHSVKEPMFPRRQVVSQPESRTLERAKRNSVHEGSRGQYGHSGMNNKPATSPGDSSSMRRTHSLLEVSKPIPDHQGDSRVKLREVESTSNGESRFPIEADSEPDIYYVHRSRGFTPPVSNKVPERIALDECDETYSRADIHLDEALPTTFKFDEEDGEVKNRSPNKFEEEKLIPAKLKPAKEKTNLDSKGEERGEYDRRIAQSPQNGQNQGRTKVDSPRRYASDEGKENRFRGTPDQTTHTSYSTDNVPKHSMKISQARVGESFSYPDKYSLETAKAAGIPIIPDGSYVPYEGFHDNRELEEQLANQNFSKTTLYVPGGDNKTQYIIIQTGDKGKEIEENIVLENKEPISTTSFAQLSKLRDTQKGGINIVYMQHDRDHNFDANRHPLKSSFLQKKSSTEKKTTSFASLPNTTTWSQQQAALNTVSPSLDSGHETPSDGGNDAPLAAQVHNVRLKLEEKRRRIETEKRKMELILNRARQKVGKAAFLQAVSRGKGSGRNTPDSGASGDLSSPTSGGGPVDEGSMSSSQAKSYTMEEIADNLNAVQNKWLESQMSVDTLSTSDSNRPSPDVDGVTFEEYTRSLERLNSNLSELQTDIQRLSQQQVQMQRFVHNGLIPMPHANEGYYVEGSHPSRQQWEPPQRLVTEDQMRLPTQSGQRSHWGPTVVSVRPDVHVSPAMQQRMSGSPFFMNQENYNVHHQPQHHEGFSLQPQSQQSSQNGPSHDQFTSYVPYNMQPQQYGGQVSYHQQMPQQQQHQQQPQHATEMYGHGHYAPPQPQSVPFRLHVEGPSTSISQQQPQMVYQKQVMGQSPQRPTSIHTSAPSKTAPMQAPPESYMEPQAVHFIETDGQDERELEHHGSLNNLESLVNTSTYRVRDSTSPIRPVLGRTFRVPKVSKGSSPIPDSKERSPLSDEEFSSSLSPQIRCTAGSDKGFFVAFDDDQPRKAKPPLRIKKTMRSMSRDEDGYVSTEADGGDSVHVSTTNSRASSLERSGTRSKEQSPKPPRVSTDSNNVIRVKLQPDSGEPSASVATAAVIETPPVGFIIAEPTGQPESAEEDEMAKKKERILLNALRRKEEQELKRAKQEQEGAQRREQERIKQEMLERKREDEKARRQAILDQYKQRKALEDQEPFSNEIVKTSTLPKSRAKQSRQRPKSLHESALAGADSRSSNLNLSSSGGRGSQQNLSSQSSDTSPYRGYSEVDVGIGRSTPPRRAPSPGQYVYRNPLSPGSGPPSLPPGLVGRRGGHVSDTASDTCSTTSLEYTGPKLFKQPTAKSNRGIIINAINTVLAGAVNQETKKRALEEIAQCDSKHFLILFRDSGCQFRALYSFSPEREEVFKLFGTGPKQVNQQMIDRYFKYNSGGKSFMEIQTKHLTVTIDAFTIHNTLWQGKKGTLPKKELY